MGHVSPKSVTDTRMSAPRVPKPRSLARLAPLEHVRNLYEGACASLPPGIELRIREKKDIVALVRA